MSLGPAYEGNMRRVIQVGLIGFAAFMLMFALLRSPTADASAVYASPYTFDQTYATAVRLIRVDMGFKILERDKDLGYVMFEILGQWRPERARMAPASVHHATYLYAARHVLNWDPERAQRGAIAEADPRVDPGNAEVGALASVASAP